MGDNWKGLVCAKCGEGFYPKLAAKVDAQKDALCLKCRKKEQRRKKHGMD